MTDQQATTTAEDDDTLHLLGENYAVRFAAVDVMLDPREVRAAAAQIIEVYRVLVTDPATQPELETVVALQLLRAATPGIARELFDAAIRHLDDVEREDELPAVEASELDAPTPADMAASVFITVPGDASYFVNAFSLIELDQD